MTAHAISRNFKSKRLAIVDNMTAKLLHLAIWVSKLVAAMIVSNMTANSLHLAI